MLLLMVRFSVCCSLEKRVSHMMFWYVANFIGWQRKRDSNAKILTNDEYVSENHIMRFTFIIYCSKYSHQMIFFSSKQHTALTCALRSSPFSNHSKIFWAFQVRAFGWIFHFCVQSTVWGDNRNKWGKNQLNQIIWVRDIHLQFWVLLARTENCKQNTT